MNRPTPAGPFVNFSDDPKTKQTIAYCTRCRAPYRDWNARENIALCPECRQQEKTSLASVREPT